QLNIIYSPAEERFDRITRMARSVFEMPVALISLVMMGNALWFKSKQGTTGSGADENDMMSMCGRCIMNDDPFVIEDTHLHPVFKNNKLVIEAPFVRFYAGMPLRTDTGLKVGTLCLLDTKARKFSEDKQDMLRDMAYWVENELKMSVLSDSHQELSDKFDELKRKAMIDPLTQVWNRNGMDEVVCHELSRAERKGSSVTLMLIDVDNFKDINDRYGHQAGDLMLQEVAQRIRISVRPHDILIRYGGDEFMVILSDCNKKAALEIAERARTRVFDVPVIADGQTIKTTLSIGLVTKEKIKSDMLEELIKEADIALYKAKDNGRNRLEMYAA
ncbi:MAG: sensor domain-containing diguanylate cyclase, partial [Gammaproteobacteria bacterium]